MSDAEHTAVLPYLKSHPSSLQVSLASVVAGPVVVEVLVVVEVMLVAVVVVVSVTVVVMLVAVVVVVSVTVVVEVWVVVKVCVVVVIVVVALIVVVVEVAVMVVAVDVVLVTRDKLVVVSATKATARKSAQQRIENSAMPVGVHAAAPSPPPAATKKPAAHAVLVQIFLLSSAHPVPRAALAWTSWCEHRRAPTDAHSAAASV